MEFLKKFKSLSKSFDNSSLLKSQNLYGEDLYEKEKEWLEDMEKKRDKYFKRKEKKKSNRKIEEVSQESLNKINAYLEDKDSKKLNKIHEGVIKLIAEEEAKQKTEESNPSEKPSGEEDLSDLANMFESPDVLKKELPEVEDIPEEDTQEDLLEKVKPSEKKEEKEEEKEEELTNFDLGTLFIAFEANDTNPYIKAALREAGFKPEHYKFHNRSYNLNVDEELRKVRYELNSKTVLAPSREVVEDMFDDLLSELGPLYRDGNIELYAKGPKKDHMEELIQKVA